MTPSRDRGWARTLVRLCLLSWPRRVRRRDGDAALATILDVLDGSPAAPLSGPLLLASECATLCRAGFQMRLRGLAEATRGFGAGWGGDVHVALRGLRRSPVFTTAATLTLAIGIGGNAAVLGLVDQIFRGPSPYRSPEHLVLVWNTLGGAPGRLGVSAPDVATLGERTRSFEGLAFMSGIVDAALEDDQEGGAEHVRLATVSDEFFGVLGVTPLLGRDFERAAEGPGLEVDGGQGPTSVLLSHSLWRASFAAERAVIGRTVRLNGRPARVVGVLPAEFVVELSPDASFDVDADVWAPLDMPLSDLRRADGRRRDRDSDNTGVTVARVRADVSVDEAAAEISDFGRELQGARPDYEAADLRFEARSMRGDATAHLTGLARALVAGGVVLLFAACLNVSALVLARGLSRSREFAVRRAIGAGRLRLLRTVVTESVILVLAGTLLASAFAGLVSRALVSAMPPPLAALAEPTWSLPVVGVSALLTGAFVLLVGAVPPLSMGAGRGRGLATAASSRVVGPGVHGGTSARGVLVLAQLALSVLLVLGSTLLMSSARDLSRTRPGFEPDGVLTFSLSLRTPGRYASPGERARFMREVETAVASIPGVSSTGLVGELPLGGGRWTQPYGLPGQAEHEWEQNRADFRVVTSHYFEAMGVRLLEGRFFTSDEDLVEDRRVVIVDERLAARISNGGSVVGAEIGFPLDGSAVRAEVVGVVEHVRHDDLGRDGREALYVPYRQEASRDVSFVVRSDRSLEALALAVRATVFEIDPQVPLYAVGTMTEYVDGQIAPTRFALVLLGAFGLLTLFAAAMGLYGVIAFDVARRTSDIAVRMAVGASVTDVLRPFLFGGLRLGAIGLGVGCLSAVSLAVVFRSWLRDVPLDDPLPWVITAAIILTVTSVASWVPARRASRLDPTVAFRVE